MADTKIVGRILQLNKTGWGFITSRDIQFTRIFFHWTSLRRDTLPFLELRPGMYVEFTALEIPMKGWRAVHIRVIDSPVRKEKDDNDESNTVPALPE